MKFGINAQVIIALLGALYILMVCREKYRIEYAEGEPVAEDEPETIVIGGQEAEVSEKTTEPLRPDYSTKPRVALPGVRPTVMPKPGSVDFILSKARRADQPRTAVKKVEKNGKKLTMKERAIADKEAAARAGVPRPTKEKFPHKGPRPAVMPKPGSPGSADFIMNKMRRADEPRPAVMPKPGSADFIMNKARRADEPRLAVMLKPGSADFIVNKVRRADEPRPLGLAGAKAKKTSVAKAPIVAVKAEKNSIIEEEGQAMIEEEATIEGQAMIEEEDTKYLVSDEELMIEGQAMIEEEGMSTGAIAGITAVSIVALIAIMIMMIRLRR